MGRVLGYYLLALAVFGLDQGTKWLVRASIAPGAQVAVLGRFVSLTYTVNRGAAFGILQGRLGFLTVVALVCAIGSAVYLLAVGAKGPALQGIGASLVLGGAMGNLADRLRLGHVVDFIDVGSWPVFNAADSAIVAGAVLMAAALIVSPTAKRERGREAS